MANSTTQRIATLPVGVQTELDSIANGRVHFKKINFPNDFLTISSTLDTDLVINDSTSSNVLFTEALKSGFVSKSGYQGVLTGGTSRYFRNLSNVSSTTTVSSIYEHIRGYVYRDFGASGALSWNHYLATTAGICGLIISKTLSSASHAAAIKNSFTGSGAASSFTPVASVSAVRVIAMNRGFFKDRIKPGTWRMKIRPTGNSTLPEQRGLNFNNDLITSTVSSGGWASITGMAGLTGSLSAGISGSMLTGFTIMLRIKPVKGGPPLQTLFGRRSGDASQTALNYISLINNSLVQDQYRNLNPLSAIVDASSNSMYDANGNLTVYNLANNSDQSVSSLTGSTSAIIKLTNSGGGILRWGVLGSDSYLRLKLSQNMPIVNGSFSGNLSGWVISAGTPANSSSSIINSTITWLNIIDLYHSNSGFSHRINNKQPWLLNMAQLYVMHLKNISFLNKVQLIFG